MWFFFFFSLSMSLVIKQILQDKNMGGGGIYNADKKIICVLPMRHVSKTTPICESQALAELQINQSSGGSNWKKDNLEMEDDGEVDTSRPITWHAVSDSWQIYNTFHYRCSCGPSYEYLILKWNLGNPNPTTKWNG